MSSLETNASRSNGHGPGLLTDGRGRGRGLYSAVERRRRDGTRWTLVQGVLAPVQFLVFLVSLGLVVRAILTGEGHGAAMASVIVKTLVLYTIMVTGSIWEKVVFGKWLFAPAFFWEDVVSMGVIALHTAYVVMALAGYGTATEQLLVALVAYAAYAINAAQFVLKLRAARLEGVPATAGAGAREVPA
ncbi:2-vinyl bacteriochlorophyllide hydratase [Fulvimarina endophytica]|uniref:2-vinyl bacteriochlorophyllide hydratase n=1 Tax=Fulvimarina endophytica TaxID=2293836 RepID=A0A371X6T2_9HYPH|nr:2-vinyl bacteriochlorophyllide hydratase [Fulvimarina endophytica]RFC64940.1 2-vinyl bacteriochlorophyllide hydratase [Fulvimarina endophytica]